MTLFKHSMRMSMFWAAIISLFGLAACTGPEVRLVPVCLDQYSYTPQQQQALADERETYRGKYPMTDLVIGNYADVRTQNRICITAQKKYFQKWGSKAPGLSQMFPSK